MREGKAQTYKQLIILSCHNCHRLLIRLEHKDEGTSGGFVQNYYWMNSFNVISGKAET